MKREAAFLAIAVVATIAAVPASANLQRREHDLKEVQRQNRGLHFEIKTLKEQLEEQQKKDQQIRDENIRLEKELRAKIEREQWLAGLTFPVGNAPAWKVRDALAYYMDSGMTRTAAAYMVGNLVAESNLDHTNKSGDGGLAWGLAQWHPNRRHDMPDDYHSQLAFTLTEMKRQTPRAYAMIFNDPTPDEASQAMKIWEAYGVEGGRAALGQYILGRI